MRPHIARVINPAAYVGKKKRVPSGEIKYTGDYEDIAKYFRVPVVDHIDCTHPSHQLFLYQAIRSLAEDRDFQVAVTAWMEKLVAQATERHADPSRKVRVLEELRSNPAQGVISLSDNLLHMWV